MSRPRWLIGALATAVAASAVAGCNSSQEIVAEGLAADNPAQPDEMVGPPPVPPAALGITATPMPPTRTSRIAPDPILPKMDDAWEDRRLPAEAEPMTPADRPADQEQPPEDVYQPEGLEVDRPGPAGGVQNEGK